MVEIISEKEQLWAAWKQSKIPIILRREGKGQKLRVRLPIPHNSLIWLKNGKRISPVWNEKKEYWEIPKAWFNDFVDRALRAYGRLYVVQPYREFEKCAPACQNANGHECQCSCMGAYHGADNDGSWFEVSDAFSGRWGEQYVACRLMIKKRH